MLATLIGLVAAMIFSFATYMIYGLEGVMTQQWIDQVFWALILAGVAVGIVNSIWRCLACEISKRLHNQTLTDWTCSSCRH
ncbi:MAG TPA: hypothetical protein ENJ98_04125 [Thiolapillus brandeum]|uniref:Uncharacterized protein n=1 Tax=Thiolapillus brandeum TaxID=1076588 RepID=A0A7C5MWZ1_9GAMM|nr:hypothetical protein [Thiolapillus brandeum]